MNLNFLTFLRNGRAKQARLVENASSGFSEKMIALVSCVKQKRDRPSAARGWYVSTLFRLSRRYAEGHSDEWFILSAKYGLVNPSMTIDPLK